MKHCAEVNNKNVKRNCNNDWHNFDVVTTNFNLPWKFPFKERPLSRWNDKNSLNFVKV